MLYWQKGWSICETVELGAGVIASKTLRHTIADRTAAILAKKPMLKGIAASAGGKLRILVFKNERTVEVHAPGWKAPRIYPMTAFSGTLAAQMVSQPLQGNRDCVIGCSEALQPVSRGTF